MAEYTSTDFYQITLEVQLAVYNSVVLAWKEKVSWCSLQQPAHDTVVHPSSEAVPKHNMSP